MTPHDPHRPHSPRIRNIVGFSAIVMLIFLSLSVYQGVRDYQDTLNKSKQNTARLNKILANYTELTFMSIDLSLRRAIERQYFNTLFGNNLPSYTEQNFKLWLDEVPPVVALALVNEQGQVEVAAHKKGFEQWMDYRRSLAGQKLFEQMREAEDNFVFRGKYTSPAGTNLILLCRRFTKLNGEFGGIVMAAVNPDYFNQFYKSIAKDSSAIMAIMLPDGTDMASSPEFTGIIRTTLLSLLRENGLPEMEPKIYQQDNKDQTRIFALQSLENIPLITATVLEGNNFMHEWRISRMRDAGFLVLFTLFGSGMAYIAVGAARQIIRVEESEGAAILASQAKSEFLANMSHELRTPLNAIIGFSEMINSGYFGPLNAKQKERVHDINLCGSHLLQLINDILEFSKGEAGKLELVEERVDLSEIVEECTRIMSSKIKGKGIELVLENEPNLPLIWGDKRKIRQVLLNLISNAVKFTPEGG